MSDAKHTEGPWRVVGDRGDGWGWIVSGPFIPDRPDEFFDLQDGTLTEKQAHLIAAAPDLLEALEAALQHACEYQHMLIQPRDENYYIHRENLRPHFEAMKEIACAAIAKAKGEA